MRFMTKDKLSLFSKSDDDRRLGNEIDIILHSFVDAWFGMNLIEKAPEDGENPTTGDSPNDNFINIDSDHSNELSP